MRAALPLLLLALACAPSGPPPMVVLEGDAAPFVEDFNAAAGRPRLVVILPPT